MTAMPLTFGAGTQDGQMLPTSNSIFCQPRRHMPLTSLRKWMDGLRFLVGGSSSEMQAPKSRRWADLCDSDESDDEQDQARCVEKAFLSLLGPCMKRAYRVYFVSQRTFSKFLAAGKVIIAFHRIQGRCEGWRFRTERIAA